MALQGEDWAGMVSFFCRDVMLSDKVLPLFEPEEPPVRGETDAPMVNSAKYL